MGCCNAAVTACWRLFDANPVLAALLYAAVAACWRLFDANPVLAALLYLLFWPFLELAFFYAIINRGILFQLDRKFPSSSFKLQQVII